MITCLSLGENGRLGNQLFQIAAVIGHAHHHNEPYAFKEWGFGKYFKNFKSELVKGTSFLRKVEPTLDFGFLPLNTKDNHGTDLWGYFQSEKYFEHCEDEVRQIFEFDESKFAHLPKIGEDVIAIHIRRGDYVGHPHYVQLPLQYYYDGIEYIQKNHSEAQNIIVFSDDIEWCRKNIQIKNLVFSGYSEIEDLYLMSKCSYHVIANSSFSWWGAWLANSKMVVAPGTWFNGELAAKCHGQDIIPTRWTLSPVPKHKTQATDLTFTIPVMFDHTDRIENLDACLQYITHHFNTNIIVFEQGKTKHFADVAKKYGAQYLFHKTEDTAFRRTWMLNEMAKAATTAFIANWDCDVIIHFNQILGALKYLRNGGDMCYPYDGRFHRMPRKLLRDFLSVLSVCVFDDAPKSPIEFEQTSYGGAVMFNKQSFIEGGMENQNMVSYGPEDYERYERFTKLGFSIERVSGPLYHIDHFVGENSSSANRYFAHNNAEYELIKAFQPGALEEYIKSWPWIADADMYGAKFFDAINADSIACAKAFMPKIEDKLPDIKSVVDFGCGEGAWLSACGFDDVLGIDGDWVNDDRLLIPKDKFIRADVGQKLTIHKKFDLAVCLEVGEHLPEQNAEQLIDNLTAHADTVLFGAAIPGQGGMNHINEQWQSYWAKKLRARGFEPVMHFRDEDDVAYFYAQNAVLYLNSYVFVPKKELIEKVDYVSPIKYMEKLEQLS